LPVNRPLAGVMQNMNLPEGQEDFAGFGFHTAITVTEVGYRLLLSGCQSPITTLVGPNENKIQPLAQSG
jgi:hypothetical protein